jgi:hypothetical protein
MSSMFNPTKPLEVATVIENTRLPVVVVVDADFDSEPPHATPRIRRMEARAWSGAFLIGLTETRPAGTSAAAIRV